MSQYRCTQFRKRPPAVFNKRRSDLWMRAPELLVRLT
jgi:hypothetical protein